MTRKPQLKHELIPEHIKLSDKEAKALFKSYNVSIKEIPKINVSDPAIAHLSVKEGDVVMIKRKSRVAGDIAYYRGVIKE